MKRIKQLKTTLSVGLMVLLTSHVSASIKTELDNEYSTGVEQFCFQDSETTNVKLVESNVITVSNIDGSVPVEIKGRGEYSINGKDMSRTSAMVKNGDRIQLRHQSLDTDGAKVSTTLVVGDVYDVFTTVTNRGGRADNMYTIEGSACQQQR